MTQTQLKLSQIRPFYSFCEEQSINFREVIGNIIDENNDFEVDDFRFINSFNIDEIQKEELLSDKYILGCFTDWFISDITGIDLDVVKRAQKAEDFELLGELMAKNIDYVQEKYSQLDGYGHHFGHYDGNEYEVGNYYAFKVN